MAGWVPLSQQLERQIVQLWAQLYHLTDHTYNDKTKSRDVFIAKRIDRTELSNWLTLSLPLQVPHRLEHQISNLLVQRYSLLEDTYNKRSEHETSYFGSINIYIIHNYTKTIQFINAFDNGKYRPIQLFLLAWSLHLMRMTLVTCWRLLWFSWEELDSASRLASDSLTSILSSYLLQYGL